MSQVDCPDGQLPPFKSPFSSRAKKKSLSTYSKILFRFNFLRLPYSSSSPQQRNSRVSEGNVNDQDQDFQRQLALVQEEKAEDHKRRSQQACQHRLLVRLLVLLLLLLLCVVLGVLPQHYFPMDVSTEIFPTRTFQMGVSGVHAGVWGVLTEKFHSSKLMGLYGAARDVPPLFLI